MAFLADTIDALFEEGRRIGPTFGARPVPQTNASRLSEAEMSELRLALLTQREKLLDDIAELRNQSELPSGQKRENGSQDSERDALWREMLARRAIDQKLWLLHEIDRALNRMLSNTYGLCEVTCRPISVERLREIPWARQC